MPTRSVPPCLRGTEPGAVVLAAPAEPAGDEDEVHAVSAAARASRPAIMDTAPWRRARLKLRIPSLRSAVDEREPDLCARLKPGPEPDQLKLVRALDDVADR